MNDEGRGMQARIVCFGELLLRLGAPGRQLLMQEPHLDVYVGGAEANVAVSLARYGHESAMVSVVPDNALGEAGVGELRRCGVDARTVAHGPGRMGLYFLTNGAMHRPSDVLYDRAHSAFAAAAPERYDWPALLAGATHLHLSGVTPAVGANAAAAAVRAMQAARAQGLIVSFDGNFRAKLWDAWKGDAPGILRQLFACADLLFADHRDITKVLGIDFAHLPAVQRNSAAAASAFEAFPGLQRMATTVRVQRSVDHHELSAIMITRTGAHSTEGYELAGIVDRIGAGDAFAAGVLHGLITSKTDQDTLRFGLAAAVLKHSIPGDFNLATVADVEALMGEQRYDVKR